MTKATFSLIIMSVLLMLLYGCSGGSSGDFRNSDVNVVTKNSAPVADAGPDQTATVGMEVSFDGSNSYDPDGEITYEWDFGDGSTGAGVNPTHTYSTADEYTVILTVTDGGDTVIADTDIPVVTVADGPLVMHVDDIVMPIKEGGNTLVKGATVYGSWSGLTNDTDSGITDESGTVSFKSDKVKNANGTFTFTVDSIIKDGWNYYQFANGETSDSITP